MTKPGEPASIDPDDPRPASQQIANQLRAAILTRRLQPGERLPSQIELAERYNVARETVKGALRILRDDKLIVSRQGSGAFVRAQTERPVGLRPHIEAAFEQATVTLDFAGFSGETLHGAIQEPLDKIRAGRLTPSSVAIRILLPNLSQPGGIPRLATSTGNDQAVRDRAERIAHRHIEAIGDSIRELAELGLVGTATVTVRSHDGFPAFKLYILNGVEAFYGFYPVVEHTVTIAGEPTPIYDVMGKDATLFHFAIDDIETSTGGQYVEQARAWFDSVWNTVAAEYTP
jgi:DNA-binding transcriptional regulator YhcF (GntR family)